MTITGANLSLLLGVDIVREVQFVGRAGALMWQEDYDSRFDIPGRPAIHAKMEDSGTGGTLGVALTYRFAPGWQLEGRYEYATLDKDRVTLVTLGLSYDFVGLLSR